MEQAARAGHLDDCLAEHPLLRDSVLRATQGYGRCRTTTDQLGGPSFTLTSVTSTSTVIGAASSTIIASNCLI